MARTKDRTKRRTRCAPMRISAETGCWIKYRLNLRNITLKTVAKNANVCDSIITDFLKGNKASGRAKIALADILGYESFERLLAASRGKGEAV